MGSLWESLSNTLLQLKKVCQGTIKSNLPKQDLDYLASVQEPNALRRCILAMMLQRMTLGQK